MSITIKVSEQLAEVLIHLNISCSPDKKVKEALAFDDTRINRTNTESFTRQWLNTKRDIRRRLEDSNTPRQYTIWLNGRELKALGVEDFRIERVTP